MIKNFINKKTIIIMLCFLTVLIFWINYLLGLCFLSFAIINIGTFQLYRRAVPDIFKNDKRNYKQIIIGSKKINEEIDDALILTAYKRTLQADNIILKRMYSFLSENGTILFIINLFEDSVFGINPSDVYFMHQVTMNELNIMHTKIRYYMPLLVNPIYFCGFLFWNASYHKKKKEQISLDKKKTIIAWINDIQKFCDERNILCKFQLIGLEDDIKYIKINCLSQIEGE